MDVKEVNEICNWMAERLAYAAPLITFVNDEDKLLPGFQ